MRSCRSRWLSGEARSARRASSGLSASRRANSTLACSAARAAEQASVELARREAERPLEALRADRASPDNQRDLHERIKLHQNLGARRLQRAVLRARVALA